MSTQTIRDAVQDGDYVRAAELFAEWAGALSPGEEALHEMADLAGWVRTVVVREQAHMQGRVQRLREETHAAAAYGRCSGNC